MKTLLRAFQANDGLIGEGSVEAVQQSGQSPAVLALHGFGCTPGEVALLTDLAQRLGLGYAAPLLPGHGTRARDLAPTRYREWYAAAEDKLLALSDSGPVIVCGQSMGAVIALDLAAQHVSRVCGVVALANATRLCSPYPALALALAARLGVRDFQMPKFGGADISDAALKRTHVTYGSQPFHAAEDLRRAGLRVRAALGRVTCPAFIAHGLYDHVCPVANAWDVADRLGTSDVEVVLLARSFHILTKDRDQERLRRRLNAFFERLIHVQRPVEP